MSMTKIFSIYDSKGEIYAQPFFQRNVNVAIRTFTNMVNDERSQISSYPEDYTLFEIGMWDDVKGIIITHKTALSVGKGIDFQKKEGQLNMLDKQ